jgi:hypothetical protein
MKLAATAILTFSLTACAPFDLSLRSNDPNYAAGAQPDGGSRTISRGDSSITINNYLGSGGRIGPQAQPTPRPRRKIRETVTTTREYLE